MECVEEVADERLRLQAALQRALERFVDGLMETGHLEKVAAGCDSDVRMQLLECREDVMHEVDAACEVQDGLRQSLGRAEQRLEFAVKQLATRGQAATEERTRHLKEIIVLKDHIRVQRETLKVLSGSRHAEEERRRGVPLLIDEQPQKGLSHATLVGGESPSESPEPSPAVSGLDLPGSAAGRGGFSRGAGGRSLASAARHTDDDSTGGGGGVPRPRRESVVSIKSTPSSIPHTRSVTLSASQRPLKVRMMSAVQRQMWDTSVDERVGLSPGGKSFHALSDSAREAIRQVDETATREADQVFASSIAVLEEADAAAEGAATPDFLALDFQGSGVRPQPILKTKTDRRTPPSRARRASTRFREAMDSVEMTIAESEYDGSDNGETPLDDLAGGLSEYGSYGTSAGGDPLRSRAGPQRGRRTSAGIRGGASQAQLKRLQTMEWNHNREVEALQAEVSELREKLEQEHRLRLDAAKDTAREASVTGSDGPDRPRRRIQPAGRGSGGGAGGGTRGGAARGGEAEDTDATAARQARLECALMESEDVRSQLVHEKRERAQELEGFHREIEWLRDLQLGERPPQDPPAGAPLASQALPAHVRRAQQAIQKMTVARAVHRSVRDQAVQCNADARDQAGGDDDGVVMMRRRDSIVGGYTPQPTTPAAGNAMSRASSTNSLGDESCLGVALDELFRPATLDGAGDKPDGGGGNGKPGKKGAKKNVKDAKKRTGQQNAMAVVQQATGLPDGDRAPPVITEWQVRDVVEAEVARRELKLRARLKEQAAMMRRKANLEIKAIEAEKERGDGELRVLQRQIKQKTEEERVLQQRCEKLVFQVEELRRGAAAAQPLAPFPGFDLAGLSEYPNNALHRDVLETVEENKRLRVAVEEARAAMQTVDVNTLLQRLASMSGDQRGGPQPVTQGGGSGGLFTPQARLLQLPGGGGDALPDLDDLDDDDAASMRLEQFAEGSGYRDGGRGDGSPQVHTLLGERGQKRGARRGSKRVPALLLGSDPHGGGRLTPSPGAAKRGGSIKLSKRVASGARLTRRAKSVSQMSMSAASGASDGDEGSPNAHSPAQDDRSRPVRQHSPETPDAVDAWGREGSTTPSGMSPVRRGSRSVSPMGSAAGGGLPPRRTSTRRASNAASLAAVTVAVARTGSRRRAPAPKTSAAAAGRAASMRRRGSGVPSVASPARDGSRSLTPATPTIPDVTDANNESADTADIVVDGPSPKGVRTVAMPLPVSPGKDGLDVDAGQPAGTSLFEADTPDGTPVEAAAKDADNASSGGSEATAAVAADTHGDRDRGSPDSLAAPTAECEADKSPLETARRASRVKASPATPPRPSPLSHTAQAGDSGEASPPQSTTAGPQLSAKKVSSRLDRGASAAKAPPSPLTTRSPRAKLESRQSFNVSVVSLSLKLDEQIDEALSQGTNTEASPSARSTGRASSVLSEVPVDGDDGNEAAPDGVPTTATTAAAPAGDPLDEDVAAITANAAAAAAVDGGAGGEGAGGAPLQDLQRIHTPFEDPMPDAVSVDAVRGTAGSPTPPPPPAVDDRRIRFIEQATEQLDGLRVLRTACSTPQRVGGDPCVATHKPVVHKIDKVDADPAFKLQEALRAVTYHPDTWHFVMPNVEAGGKDRRLAVRRKDLWRMAAGGGIQVHHKARQVMTPHGHVYHATVACQTDPVTIVAADEESTILVDDESRGWDYGACGTPTYCTPPTKIVRGVPQTRVSATPAPTPQPPPPRPGSRDGQQGNNVVAWVPARAATPTTIRMELDTVVQGGGPWCRGVAYCKQLTDKLAAQAASGDGGGGGTVGRSNSGSVAASPTPPLVGAPGTPARRMLFFPADAAEEAATAAAGAPLPHRRPATSPRNQHNVKRRASALYKTCHRPLQDPNNITV